MKLYATLETARGKVVSISDNQEIIATLYDGNLKAYTVTIEWREVGQYQGKPLMGASIKARDWTK